MTTIEKDIYAIGEVPPLGFVPKKNARMGNQKRSSWKPNAII